MPNTFKRSRKVALMWMVPATTLLMAGCGEEPTVEAAVYQNAEECAAFYNPPASCNAEFEQAKTLHAQVAPKYTDLAACEADFGNGQCETPATTSANSSPQAQQSSSFFMPMMMGFMAGQMLNRGGQASQSVATQPLYKAKDDKGTFRTASNQPVARQSGPVKVNPSKMAVRPGTLVQRGGFGSQAQQRSSMGG